MLCVQQDTYRLQVQSWLQASNNTGILNTFTRLWLTESEQATLVDSIKDIVRSSVNVPEFDKQLKKARGHIDQNIMEITIKMKTIVWKPLMINKSLVNYVYIYIYIYIHARIGGARGVMVIVVGNRHNDTSTNPGRDWLHFT